jgi:hypothetical protein
MKVIRPTIVTDAILTSSTIAEPETGYPAYNPATAYADKAHVTVAAVHHRYEAIGAVAAGTYPPDHPDKWLDLGATNKWAMFDQAKGSLSTATGQMVIVLTPGRIDSLALLDLAAKQVTVKVTVSGVEVYSRTLVTAVGGNNIDNWFDWFFAPIGQRTALLFDDLPSFRTGVVTVTIDGASSGSAVACGTMLLGNMFEIGTTLSGVDIGIDDFTTKVRDNFGVVRFVERPFSDTVSYQVAIPSTRVDAAKAVLTALRATPTIYVGADGLDALFTYGIYKSFRINLVLLTGVSNVSLDLEGLV